MIELPDASANYITIQVVVKTPPGGPFDRAVNHLLADTLLDDSERYSKRELLDLLSAGTRLRCDWTPDEIRIQMGVEPSDLAAAMDAIKQIFTHATFPAEDLQAIKDDAPFRHPGFWDLGLYPERDDTKYVDRRDVLDAYHRLFIPSNVWIGFGGDFAAGKAVAAWNTDPNPWPIVKTSTWYPDKTAGQDVRSDSTGVTTLRLDSPSFPANDAAFPTKLLALYALGVGKGATEFQVLREQMRWSYRQEVMLMPTASGFEMSAMMAMNAGDKTAPSAEQMRDALLKGVAAWTQADLDRAVAMAQVDFTRGLDGSPLYLCGDWPIGQSLEDRTFLAAYWLMKTGSPFDSDALLAGMRASRLEEVRDQATAFLKDAKATTILGG